MTITLPSRHQLAAGVLTLLMCITASLPLRAQRNGSGAVNACARWPQSRLVLGGELQSRSFMLEPNGEVELIPPAVSGTQRSIYHRTFSLALDVAERISLFYSNRPQTFLISRDHERTKPLKMPVFFVGRLGEPADELKENAENVAFAPSATLNKDDNFADIAFRLRKGGSRFSEIRPFFRCGLPGLLVCERSCPDDNVSLADLLVDTVIKGQTLRQKPLPKVASEKLEPTKPRTGIADSGKAAPAPTLPAGTPATPQTAPAAPPSLPETDKSSEPARPRVAPAPKPPEEPRITEQPTPAAPAIPAKQQFVITLVRPGGTAVEAAEVLQAEGPLSIEGAPLTKTAEGLSVSLADEAARRLDDVSFMKKLFPHYAVSSLKAEGTRIIVTADPHYVRADDIVIKIRDLAGERVKNCDLVMDVAAGRRVGSGWQKLSAEEKRRGLHYVETDNSYRLDLAADIDESELLISIADPGNAARLSNVAPGCVIEARPWVEAVELKALAVSRSLQPAGPVFIALFSADSEFESWLTPSAVEGFWSAAFGLATAVGKQPWERFILARGQAPGANQYTKMLQDVREHGVALDEAALLKNMDDDSRLKPEPRTIIRLKPLERFHLDIALKLIRNDAGISKRNTVGKEALLLVSGSVRSPGSYFCQYPLRRDTAAPWVAPQWVKQARKVFVLEVWSNAAAEAMQRLTRAKHPDDAPAGIFLCGVPGADGDKIALYGVLPSILSSDSERSAAFNYLSDRADGFLKP
jgi:hypothetical protein